MSRSRASRSASAPPQIRCGSFSATWRLSLPVGALGQPHRAHAAAAQLRDQAVGADHVAGRKSGVVRRGVARTRQLGRGGPEGARLHLPVCGEQFA